MYQVPQRGVLLPHLIYITIILALGVSFIYYLNSTEVIRKYKPIRLPNIQNPYLVLDSRGERNKFIVKDLRISGGDSIFINNRGGTFAAELDILFDCQSCPSETNQLILGLSGQGEASNCIWAGGKSSGRWQTVKFFFEVPDKEGDYHIRIRDSQAFNCRDAMGWWGVGTKGNLGPGSEANIGLVRIISNNN